MYTAILHIGDIAYDLDKTIEEGPHLGENVSTIIINVINPF